MLRWEEDKVERRKKACKVLRILHKAINCGDCNVMFSYQLCEVLATTESGLPEAHTNHRN